jgi:hypothetical protein
MLDRSALQVPMFPRAAIHVPHQAAPIDRAVSPAALDSDRSVDADLFGLPVGDWLEEPGRYAWGYAKDWLNK